MADEQPSSRPRLGADAHSEAARRRARQAAALRENLRRRKAQERWRENGPDPSETPAGGQGGPKPSDKS